MCAYQRGKNGTQRLAADRRGDFGSEGTSGVQGGYVIRLQPMEMRLSPSIMLRSGSVLVQLHKHKAEHTVT